MKLLITTIFFVAVFDPTNFLSMRNFVFMAIAIVAFLTVLHSCKIERNLILYWSIFCLFLPVYGLFVFSIRSGNLLNFNDFSYFSAGLIALTAIFFSKYENFVYGLKLLIYTGIFVAFFILLFAFMHITGNEFAGLMSENNWGFVGFRDRFDLKMPYIHMLSQPLMIPAFVYLVWRFYYYSEKYHALAIFIIFVATIIADSRTFLFVEIFIVYMFFINSRESLISRVSLHVTGVLLVVLFVIYLSTFYSVSIRDTGRLSDLVMYLKIFHNESNIFFGQGLHAKIWSTDFASMLGRVESTRTEFTYLEIIRVFGLFSLIFFSYTIFLLWSLYKINIVPFLMILSLFVIASTNPYLFSMNGIIPLSLFVNLKNVKIFFTRKSMCLQN